MNIEYKTGNLLDVTSGHIVHGCNAQGVQGAGIALHIKNKWSGCYYAYRKKFDTVGLSLGELVLYKVDNNLEYDYSRICW